MAEDSRSISEQFVNAIDQLNATSDDDESRDMDYEPAEQDDDDDDDDEATFEEYLEHLMEQGDEEDEDDEEFEDADDGAAFEVEVGISDEEDENPLVVGSGPNTIHLEDLPAPRRAIIMRILAQAQLGLFVRPGRGAEDDDMDDDDEYNHRSRRRRGPLDPNRFPKVPSEKGRQLMESGEFGGSEVQAVNTVKSRKTLARRILDRELALENGPRERANQRLMSQDMIPSTAADTIIHYDAPVYSGQFSDDGNFFYAAVKDFRVRMYDTSNPYRWSYYKTAIMPQGQWTLTDASLSPDNKSLAYTSICNMVCLAPTDPNDAGDPYMLDISDMGRRSNRDPRFSSAHQFGIFSVRWSGDGRELVVGTNRQSIYVYDIESRRSVLRIPAHDDDVNAVCFGDKLSPHIIYSGSDDATLKVWDRRSMGDSREAGAFVGHTQGLTYIDSKGDGRYILSNSKDQTMKLWDQRMMMSTVEAHRIAQSSHFYHGDFDYRWNRWDDDDYEPHPHDNSLVTFRGHSVLRTLIRCHFSPPGSTNSRYVYSGSEDGSVWIYDLDGSLKGKVDVQATTKDTRPLDRMPEYHWDPRRRSVEWKTVVRDASWHPNAPVIAASAWNGYGTQTGTVTVHAWNDGAEDDEAEPKMGVRVDEKLAHDPRLYDAGRPRASSRRFGGFTRRDGSDSD